MRLKGGTSLVKSGEERGGGGSLLLFPNRGTAGGVDGGCWLAGCPGGGWGDDGRLVVLEVVSTELAVGFHLSAGIGALGADIPACIAFFTIYADRPGVIDDC
jgi:hypothetical protein